MAAVQFSLEEGVSRVLHTFLKPPPEMVPIGYAYTIRKHAEDVSAGNKSNDSSGQFFNVCFLYWDQ
jgi:hypothetical protein